MQGKLLLHITRSYDDVTKEISSFLRKLSTSNCSMTWCITSYHRVLLKLFTDILVGVFQMSQHFGLWENRVTQSEINSLKVSVLNLSPT